MKLTGLITVFIQIFDVARTNSYLMADVIQAISQNHHFGHYIVMTTNEKLDKIFRESSAKILHSQLRFSMMAYIPIDENGNFTESIKSCSNDHVKCLKIFDGFTKAKRKRFLDVSILFYWQVKKCVLHSAFIFFQLSREINFGGRHVWLLFLDGKISLEKYLNSFMLPFNSQLILALVQNTGLVRFIAPYRVSENSPLRLSDVGRWTKKDGLNLSTVDVASTRKDLEGFQLRAGTLEVCCSAVFS